MSVVSQVASLHLQGFDKSEPIESDGGFFVRVGCSQCQAAVICGVACHERGCPNRKSNEECEDGEDD